MSTIKIEHVDPNTSHPIAFDIMAPAEDGGGELAIQRTFVLRHGQFEVLALTGELILHEVSPSQLKERHRIAKEKSDLAAEVAREKAAVAEAERVQKLDEERAAHKAEIEKAAAEPAASADKPALPSP